MLSSLFKTNGGSLTDESLQTLLVEVEAIVNSHPLTTKTITDVTSLILNIPIRNCKVRDIVLLKNEAECNQWSMAKIVATKKDDKGDV